jgi:hypothetical protein
MSQSGNTNGQCQTRVNNSENILSNSTELIVNNLQEKVSNFILQQIDWQVDRMISVNLDNNRAVSISLLLPMSTLDALRIMM